MVPRIAKYSGLGLGTAGLFVLVWANLPNSLWYRDGRPTRFGKMTNRTMGRFAATGLPSFSMVTLDVPGRKSGKTTSTVLVVAPYEGEEYLVSMLGERVDWVRNVRAAAGNAVIRHGGSRRVTLEQVPGELRAPILKAYLKRAPGGRPHFPVDKDDALEAFAAIAADYPVFRITEPDK